MVIPITVGISPNTEYDDVLRALCMFLTPWRWKRGIYEKLLMRWFEDYFPHANATFFSSGRSALTALLTAHKIGEGDEVIIQAFTCMVVPNAIRFAGATPIYVDIDETANINPKEIEKHITKKTKAIVVQHTFGTPAQMDEIINIAQKHSILVIEDCAHAFGALYKGKKVGTIGDGAIMSFGRDKILSSVMGGVAIVPSKEIAVRLNSIRDQLPYPSYGYIFQQLIHPISMQIVLPLYNVFSLGKVLLYALQKMHVVTRPVSKSELDGKKPSWYMMKYPNGLAYLLLGQLKKLETYQHARSSTSKFYAKECKKRNISYLPYTNDSALLRFSVSVPNQKQIRVRAKQHGILLGNWYHNVIDPVGSSFTFARYKKGSCPKAELLAYNIINLPTRISEHDANRIMEEFVRT